MEPRSPVLQSDSLLSEPPGKPRLSINLCNQGSILLAKEETNGSVNLIKSPEIDLHKHSKPTFDKGVWAIQ